MDRRKAWELRNPKKLSRIRTIGNWRHINVKGDLDEIYKLWLDAEYCESCLIKLGTGNKSSDRKMMDHQHSSGHFRNIVCNSCNNYRQKHDKLHLSVMMELHRYFILN